MRRLVIAALLAAALHAGRHEGPRLLQLPDATERAALDVRCGALEAPLRGECEAELLQRFADGSARPEPILRMHCTRWLGTWSTLREEPSPLCVERFGGWLRG